MDVLITLIYFLFVCCVVYPPTEFVSAGFTIEQLFEGFLGSESSNFVLYHIKRVKLTMLIHSAFPLGYLLTLWCGGERNEWMLSLAIAAATVPVIMLLKVKGWLSGHGENGTADDPVVKAFRPYVTEGVSWKDVAVTVNSEFRGVDKVSLPLTATSKLIATPTWLVKVTQYTLYVVKQADCVLVATASDSHNLTQSGEDEIQYLNVEVIPSRTDIKQFSFRITVTALQDLQPHLTNPVRVPEHISLLPSVVERFINVFKMHVEQNPVYYVEEEPELCIGCMSSPADVKLTRLCMEPPQGLLPSSGNQCQQCNCRVLWCCSCMARWWAARADGPPEGWLGQRRPCPVCRQTFCLLDVCPARLRPAASH